MAATKTTPTPKRTTTRKANPERAPKPKFVEIEHNLHYSPDGVREVVVTIDPVWSDIEPIIEGMGEDTAQSEIFMQVLSVIYGDDESRAKIRGLRTSEFFELVYEWMDRFTKLMGVDEEGE